MKNAINPIYDDPVYLFDTIMETIEKTPFGDINSVINDSLRSVISKIYGVNMNMFDTHSFTVLDLPGETASDIFMKKSSINTTLYVYEADAGNIHKANDVDPGVYKDGILLGFVEKSFRESDYSKLDYYTISYIIEQLDTIACNISNCYDNNNHWSSTPYIEYLVSIAHVVSVVGYLLKKKCPISYIQEFYNLDEDIYDFQSLKRLARNGINARYFYDDSIDVYSKFKMTEFEKKEELLTGSKTKAEDKQLVENPSDIMIDSDSENKTTYRDTNYDLMLIYYKSGTVPSNFYLDYDKIYCSHDQEPDLIDCALNSVETFGSTFIPEANVISDIIENGYSIKQIKRNNRN